VRRGSVNTPRQTGRLRAASGSGTLRRATSIRPDELQKHLLELASALLASGMTAKTFVELANRAFVEVAAETSKFLNGSVNHSRVAARTGLSRARVRRVMNADRHSRVYCDQGPMERVILGWRSDRRFTDPNRHPRLLKVSGRRSFALLVKRYGGDLPHRAVLEELRKIGAVTTIGNLVRLSTRYSRKTRAKHTYSAPTRRDTRRHVSRTSSGKRPVF
jgi:hypothetical protein